MSELHDEGLSESQAIPSSVLTERDNGSSIGGQLRSAREQRDLSVDDIARLLKLSPHQVVSIESGDWSHLPGKTIIRGFVRNYARLVGLDSDRLMAEMDGLGVHQSPELQLTTGVPVSLPREGGADRRDIARVLMGLIALVLAVLVYFFLPPDAWQNIVNAYQAATQLNETAVAPETADDVSQSANVTSLPSPPVAASEVSTNEVAMPPAAEAAMPSPVSQPDVAVPAVPAAEAPTASAEQGDPLASAAVIRFKFTQPSWVEIRDRSGKILLSQLNGAGTEREVAGDPPLSLVVGNASNVTLWYKGKIVEMTKRSKDDVARLTIE